MPPVQSPAVTLIDHLKKQGVAEETVRSLFDSLQLPVPQQYHYFTTSDKGAMLFLNACGIVLRLSVPDSEASREDNGKYQLVAISHPAVLQPLARFRYKELQVDILPGIRLAADYEVTHALKEKLARDGYDFWDVRSLGNVGYLPTQNGEDPNAFPVVLDGGAVRKIEGFNYNAPLTIGEGYQRAQEYLQK